MSTGTATVSGSRARSRTPIVVKFGGELLEQPAHLRTVTEAIASATRSIVVVHGGGREIDAALSAAGIEKRQVDGLRITDAATLEIVISVLAGSVNSKLVAALGAAGVRAVGLTGLDGRCGLCERAPAHRTVDGRLVDLGYVGVPSERADVSLVRMLAGNDFVPVLACIGVDASGQRLNVNADTLAGHIAAKLPARRLVIAGATSGVLDEEGATIPLVEAHAIDGIIASRTATAGMIAKLHACERALASGVEEVVIVDGRNGASLLAALEGDRPASATRLVAAQSTVAQRFTAAGGKR